MEFKGGRLFWKSRQLSMAATLASLLDKTVINLVDMQTMLDNAGKDEKC